MVQASSSQRVDPAFAAIEETILPGLALSLDTLLETASLAKPGVDADERAEQLRALAMQLQYLMGQIEACRDLAVGETYEAAVA